MSKNKQGKLDHNLHSKLDDMSASFMARKMSVSAILDDAERQLREVNTRRKELLRVIRNLADLKRRKMPSELFTPMQLDDQ